MFNIFKKGSKKLCSNYRGISVINSLGKIFDKCIQNRLSLWFKPSMEQAGGQKHRSTEEHIITLRLVMSFAKKKKKKLFICFIDFKKAYDKVPRIALIQLLIEYGCSASMILLIANMYSCSLGVIGTALFAIALGVRQGAPTSGLLFTIFMDKLIRSIKEIVPIDGFLLNLACLAFLDDLVILSTSRVNMMKKLRALETFCRAFNMELNIDKSKFFVINGDGNDSHSFTLDLFTIQLCQSYIYLGCPITSDASIKNAISIHASIKNSVLMKFVNFIKCNNHFPFAVKKKVMDACLNSSILYSCEAWFKSDIRCINSIYMNALKCLLGVRQSTANFIALAEAGNIPLEFLVKIRQKRLYSHLLRRNDPADPFVIIFNLCLQNNVSEAVYMNEIANSSENFLQSGYDFVKHYILSNNGSKFVTYKSINPSLIKHNVYNSVLENIEFKRIQFTRFRTSSHDLLIETGRWTRPTTPPDERLCPCCENQYIQNEYHVLNECNYTQNIRFQYNSVNFNLNMFFENTENHVMLDILWKISSIFKRVS